MLSGLFDFGVTLMRFASYIAKALFMPFEYTWGVPFVSPVIPIYDDIAETYYFGLDIANFPYNLYPNGVVPESMLAGTHPIYSINYTANTNILSVAILIIGSVFVWVVIFKVVKALVS